MKKPAFIKLTGMGILLGFSAVIPGVSTGSIAVALNIYDRLIGAITPDVKKIFNARGFLVPLVIGGILGIVIFSRTLTILFASHPVPTYWFFIGVIAGSIPQIYRRTLRPPSALPSPLRVICCVLAAGAMILTAVFAPNEESVVYTALTPPVFCILLGGGALGAAVMIIPGISGAFVLLAIGLYRTLLQAVSDFNIALILPVMLGAILGILAGAALVRLLLAKAPKETYGAILGLVIGSIPVLFPGSLGNGAVVVISLLCLITGVLLSYLSGRETKN